MSRYHLAQLNIAIMKYPVYAPQMSGFVRNIDRINAMAEKSPGFVWRLNADIESPVTAKLFGSNAIVNMSVWTEMQLLHHYVYRSAHATVMSRRKEWFEAMDQAYSVLWWISAGSTPTLMEARDKLSWLRANGPTVDAFTFKKAFPPPHDRQTLNNGDDVDIAK